MNLDCITYKNVQYNIYTKDADLDWVTFDTQKKRTVLYSIREDGLVISTNKKTYKEKIVKPVLNKGVLVVRINRKVYKIKNLVAKFFCSNYKDGSCVLTKDGNPYNCHKYNLIICDKKTCGKITGGKASCKKIKANGIQYNSVVEFCKKNYIGVRTFYDKKQCRYKTSILDDYKITYQ